MTKPTPFADMLRDPKQYLMQESARYGIAESVAILEAELATANEKLARLRELAKALTDSIGHERVKATIALRAELGEE